MEIFLNDNLLLFEGKSESSPEILDGENFRAIDVNSSEGSSSKNVISWDEVIVSFA